MPPADAPRPRWADVLDSSQEDLREDSHAAAARGLVEESSYRGEDSAPGLGSLREEFSRCARAIGALSSSGEPMDFSFLLEAPTPLQQFQESATASRGSDRAGRSGTTGGRVGSTRGPRRKRPQSRPAELDPSSPGKRARSSQAPADGARRAKAAVAGEAPAGSASAAEEAKEAEEWRHRVEKRGRAVEMIKTTPDYQAYAQSRPAGQALHGAPAPRTPDSTDRAVSKRRWEQEVQQWRAGLRQWCQERGLSTVSEPAAPQRCQPSVLELLQRQGRK